MSYFDGFTDSIAMPAEGMGTGSSDKSSVDSLMLSYNAFKDLLVTEGSIDQSASSQSKAASEVGQTIAAGQKSQSDAISNYVGTMANHSGASLQRMNAQLGVYNATLSTDQSVGSSLLSSMNGMVSATQNMNASVLANLNSFVANFSSIANAMSGFQP